MLNQAFARVLKQLRIQKGLSQEDLGLQANLHRTYISQLERGLKNPTLNTLSTIADVLGIELTRLVNLVEEESKRDLPLN